MKVEHNKICLMEHFQRMLVVILCFAFCFSTIELKAQSTDETLSAGAFIIDMGVVPQTEENGLQPYGMIYDLVSNYEVPIKWVIKTGKMKDGTDFTYNGVDYKGGPFIVAAEFRSAAVDSRISFWQGQGVQGTTTTAPITVPVYSTFYSVPVFTINDDKADLITDLLDRAGIPPSASNLKPPADLGPCDDLFAMPHSDPEWSTHGNLLDWNETYQGAVWYGCHAGSVVENMYNPANPSDQTNFLAKKYANADAPGVPQIQPSVAENALIFDDNHADPVEPFEYDYPDHPIM